MSKRTAITEVADQSARPSPWAIALLVASTGFALLSLALLTTGFGLH